MDESGFSDLKSNVIDPGLCKRCGGCVASCPEDVLVFGDGGIQLTGECIKCGTCLRICTGAGIDYSSQEKRLFSRSRKNASGTRLGIYEMRSNLTAADPAIMRSGYNGGRVSALLIRLLEEGMIDAALLTDWSTGGALSVGSAAIARNRDDVLRLASSKYVFSPVLTLLREIADDQSIESAAVVGLPCHISALRKMEVDPVARQYTGKVRYALGLHCGNGILVEEDWRKVISDMTGVKGEDIARFRAWKIKGNVVRFRVDILNGGVVESDHPSIKYMKNISKLRTWPPCSLCPDYSAELSDVSFGWPQTRSEIGTRSIRDAVKGGYLVEGTGKRVIAQFLLDIIASRRKRRSTRNEINRRKREGLPYPEYR